MIDSIPNPLTDKGVQKDIKEKVDELMSRRVTSCNEGVADTIRRLVESAAQWGMSEGFRMGWRVHEVTDGGRLAGSG